MFYEDANQTKGSPLLPSDDPILEPVAVFEEISKHFEIVRVALKEVRSALWNAMWSVGEVVVWYSYACQEQIYICTLSNMSKL